MVPALSGTNNSGPFSPTIDALPTGGLPPFANPGIPIPPKKALTPNCISDL